MLYLFLLPFLLEFLSFFVAKCLLQIHLILISFYKLLHFLNLNLNYQLSLAAYLRHQHHLPSTLSDHLLHQLIYCDDLQSILQLQPHNPHLLPILVYPNFRFPPPIPPFTRSSLSVDLRCPSLPLPSPRHSSRKKLSPAHLHSITAFDTPPPPTRVQPNPRNSKSMNRFRHIPIAQIIVAPHLHLTRAHPLSPVRRPLTRFPFPHLTAGFQPQRITLAAALMSRHPQNRILSRLLSHIPLDLIRTRRPRNELLTLS